MTRARGFKAGIAAGVIATVLACAFLMTGSSPPHSLSLVFERYSTNEDASVQPVAFLSLTNSSDKPYWLPMTGGTNTFQKDPFDRHDKGSYMTQSEFNDQANPTPQPMKNWGQCITLAPHAAIRLRVVLPEDGQKRRVAALCVEQLLPKPRKFWTQGIGLTILRLLPRSVAKQLLISQPKVLKIWCHGELSLPLKRLK